MEADRERDLATHLEKESEETETPFESPVYEEDYRYKELLNIYADRKKAIEEETKSEAKGSVRKTQRCY